MLILAHRRVISALACHFGTCIFTSNNINRSIEEDILLAPLDLLRGVTIGGVREVKKRSEGEGGNNDVTPPDLVDGPAGQYQSKTIMERKYLL